MSEIDLKIITNEQDYIIYDNKPLYFRNITVGKYFKLQIDIFSIINMPIYTEYDVKIQEDKINNLTIQLFDITEPLTDVTISHLIEINKHLGVLDMLHQGFTEEQIPQVERQLKPKHKSKYETGQLIMLSTMSTLKGWTHEYMMGMDKRMFFRYYGYWLQERLVEDDMNKEEEHKNKNNESMKNLRQRAGQGG